MHWANSRMKTVLFGTLGKMEGTQVITVMNNSEVQEKMLTKASLIWCNDKFTFSGASFRSFK